MKSGQLRRVLRVVVVFVALVGLFAFGWLAAVEFQSPAQREAHAASPEPQPILEPVVGGRLVDVIRATASVGPTRSWSVIPTSVPAAAVVTQQLMSAGDTLASGDAVAEVNGRPVFVFEGEFRFYRDLATGLEGPDVAQLQDALTSAGYEVGSWESGTFGRSTAWALRQFYWDHDYELQRGGPECPEPLEAEGDDTAGESNQEPPCEDPGWVVPLSELAVMRSLPVKLSAVRGVGSELAEGEGVATAVSGSLVASATVLPESLLRISEGMAVELVAEDGTSVAASVTSVTPAGEEGAGYVVIAPDGELPQEWDGAEVVANIVIDVVSGEALIVPSVAVSSDPAGAASVLMQREGGVLERVSVNVLGELAGRAAIEPVEDGTLKEDDRVVVG